MNSLKTAPRKYWVILLACLGIASLAFFRAFNNYELLAYDLRFKLRPPLGSSSDIVIIEISDDTLKNLGQWPLPRDFHASLVDVLKSAGARFVVFDILFAEPTLYDEAFAKAIEDAGNVYLAEAFYIEFLGRRYAQAVESHTPLADINKKLSIPTAGVGHINVFVDADGKTRRIPLFIKYKGTLVPQLGFKVACARLGLRPEDLKSSLPVLADGTFLVNYPGPWSKSFRHFSYFDILKAFADTQKGLRSSIDLSVLKGKTCFVGLTATGTSDLKPTPLESIYPMVGLQASVYNSIVERKFIRGIGAGSNACINILIFILSLTVSLRFAPLKAFLGNIALGLAYFVISSGLFILYGLWTDLFFPLLLIVLAYTAVTFYGLLQETRRRELMEKELDIARAIQKNFLPQDVKEVAGINVCSFLEPAKFVAGDLYDIFSAGGPRAGVFIGDVSGKGIPASLIMAQTISLFRIFARQYAQPSQVLGALNRELFGKFEGRFVTCLYLIIDAARQAVQVASAGHGPLFLYKKDASQLTEAELLADVPLGVIEDVAYADVEFGFSKGDKIVIFTDGVFEARNKENREFGLANIKKIILKDADVPCGRLLEDIKKDVRRFSRGAIQHDDMTLIVLGN